MDIEHAWGTRFRKNAQGIVEFALVLPLLLMLAYGIIEVGRMLFIYSSVLTSSREAARYGAAVGDIGGYVMHFEDCDGIRAAAKRIGWYAGIGDGNITITYDHGPGSSAPFASCPLAADQQVNLGDRIIVQVVSSYKPWLPLVNLPAFPITATTRRTILKNVQIEGTPPSPVTPTVSFVESDQSQEERNGPMRAVLQLSAPTDKAVVVPYTIEGTAEKGIDYSISPSQVVFGPGDTLAEILIDVIDDDMDENDEVVVLTIGTPQHAVKGSPETHLAKILDDDDPPTISFLQSEQFKLENIDGAAILQLSAASSREITVNFSVSGSAGGGGVDYTVNPGPIIIPPGNDSYPIILDITDDSLDELDETIVLTLGEVVNATKIAPFEHVYTILDEDDPPAVSFTWANQTVDESVGSASVEVELSATSGKDVSVTVTFSGTADKGSDYEYDVAIYQIPAGELTATIDVRILANGDNDENDETIDITLLNPTNATIGSPGTHIITIEETMEVPSVFFRTSTQAAVESASALTVTIELSAAPTQDVSVPLILGGTAVYGTDYTISTTTAVIPAGGARTQVEVTLVDDAIDEPDESITLALGDPVNATKGSPAIHTITITDDDGEPEIYFISSGQTESESVGNVVITARLSVISGYSVSVPFTLSGTAEFGTDKDYTISSSPLTIPAGSISGDLSLNVRDDLEIETGETVLVTLVTPTNATLGFPTSYTLTILDNEPVCPTPDSSPTFGTASDRNKLVWTLQSPNPLVAVDLMTVTISWPTGSQANVTAVTFGDPIYAGNASPPYLAVNSPSPLWSGAFTTRQMIFKFDKAPKSVSGDFYQLTATFNGCPPISGIVPSD